MTDVDVFADPSSPWSWTTVESFLNREVCRGAMQLADAQRAIATDWMAVFRQNGLKPTQ